MPEPQLIPSSHSPSASLTGTIVGRFRIGERLGHGGMGEVYRAEDTTLKRTVALKRLAPALSADAHYRRRFLEEAKSASSFSDAHIAALYDVLQENGEIFLVMEYVEGETLRQRLRRRISLQEFFGIACQCVEGLAAAHSRGIVHCDIKPENIMLTPAGQVKILDFGLAKYLPRSDQSSTADRGTTMAGTPAYMAPEVLLEKPPDGRADLFSLAVVFYEALTGHHPFLASSFVATTDRIRQETPARIRIFNREVPEALEKVVARAMAKEPNQRYGNAGELLDDLCRVRAGLPPAELQPLVPPVVRPKRKPWIIAAVLLIGVGAIAFVAYRRAQRPPLLSERAWVLISDFDTRGDDPIPDAGVREGLTIALQQSRYINVYPRTRTYEALQRMKRPDSERIDEGLGREICQRENLQVLLAGSIEHIGGIYQITVRALDPVHGTLLFAEKERFSRKEDFFDKADVLSRKVRSDFGESLSGINQSSRPLAKVTTGSFEALQLFSQAKIAMDQGKLEQALAPLQAALQLDPEFAMAHLRLGEYYSSIVGKNEKAQGEFQRAYDLREGVTDRERLWIEATYFSFQERYEDTVQSLSLLVSLYPDDPDFHLALADAYDTVAQPEKVVVELRKVLALNPQSAPAYVRLMLYLARTDANQEALAVYSQAQAHGVSTPELQADLGLAYLGMGKLPEAGDAFSKMSQNPQPFQDLGDFYLAKMEIYEGKLHSARTYLETLIQRDQMAHSKGLQLEARALLGHISLMQEQPLLARQQAEAILAAPAGDLQIVDMVSAGFLFARAQDLGSARKVLRRLQEATKGSPTAWNKRSVATLEGEIALSGNSPEAAIAAFLAAQSAYPQASTHEELALAYEANSDWKNAADHWQQLLKARGEALQEGFPANLVLAQLQLARIDRRSGDIPAALQRYEDVMKQWQGADDFPKKRQAATELQELGPSAERQGALHLMAVPERVNN